MSPTSLARLGAAALALSCAVAALRTDAAPKPKGKPHAATQPLRHTRVAPLDEYFGRLKMSVLGVRNKVTMLGLDADLHHWARKYPYDTWLPRYAYALETMYERIPGSEAHRRAIRQVDYITAYFPASAYARIGRAKLVAGVPTPDPRTTSEPDSALRRLALIDGKVQPTLPPAPVPVAVETPSPALTPAVAPASEPTPEANPTIDP